MQDATLEDIFASREGVRLKKATIIHVEKDGFVLGFDGRGVYVHNAGFSLPLGAVVDVVIHKVGTFGGAKQIEALHVEQIYAKKDDVKKHMIGLLEFEKARAGDVIDVVEGEVKDGYIITKVGKIKLYSKKGLTLNLELCWNLQLPPASAPVKFPLNTAEESAC